MLDLRKVIKLTLVRGGLFVAVFVLIEFVGGLLFGPTDISAGRDALNFLIGPAVYLMLLFFLAIFLPRVISMFIFFKAKKSEISDPALMHKLWENQ
jgi:hypothetical protein